MSDLQALIVLNDQITKLITDYDAPIENPPLIERIRFLVSWAESIDSYCYRRFQDIANEAEMFYSANKYKNLYFGADECHARMRMHLISIAHRIAEIKATQGK